MKTFVLPALLLAALPASTVSCTNPPAALVTLVDCTTQNLAPIADLLNQFKNMIVGGTPNWSAIEQDAVNAGEGIGGCALAEFSQQWFGVTPHAIGSGGPVVDEAFYAHATLEYYRAKYANGATFKTPAGNI
jgi:hypothetical protein